MSSSLTAECLCTHVQPRKPVARAAAPSSSEEETDDDDDDSDDDEEETDSDVQPAQPAARRPPLAPGAIPRACVFFVTLSTLYQVFRCSEKQSKQ